MIPRTLVPPDARPEKLIATPGRPTALDDRTLIPGTMTTGPLEEKSQIPTNLPLESITARVIVPRDAKIEPLPGREGLAPATHSELDERVAIPLGAAPPENILESFTRPEDLVEGDVFTTGEVQLLVAPVDRAARSREELVNRITTAVVYVLILIALRITPDFHRKKSATDDEIARKNVTLLLPPGPLDIPAPVRPPQPRIQVNPNVIRKVAPPELPVPVPQPQPQPKTELPSAPTAQPNSTPPAPEPKTEVAANNPLKLEVPDTPKPQPGLVLPKYGNTRPVDNAPPRQSPGFSGPRATIQNVPVPRGGGGGRSGQAYGGMAMLTPDQGVDFSVYLARVQTVVDRNWQAVIPESVQLGEKGRVDLQFRIMRDGSVPPGYPIIVRSSGKEPLDRAAVSSIRASNPFEPLPPAFTGPYIELRAIYLYNLPPEILSQE
ncbi:MAG: TonB C-terminal domain-containing protein [Acidobacteria bacterium]|nr:TonB C-terminal domain-containing protein [Acidobacteriota bacterium]MBS1865131.1 TonB C-terminal domain-containing protein [Acidobacteriota bacterium]